MALRIEAWLGVERGGEARLTSAAHIFTPLEQVTNPTVPTAPAAYYLDRMPQTLRNWACFENGPIRPIRINGRLAWPVAAIRSLLNVSAP
jgi:hypothetical protein